MVIRNTYSGVDVSQSFYQLSKQPPHFLHVLVQLSSIYQLPQCVLLAVLHLPVQQYIQYTEKRGRILTWMYKYWSCPPGLDKRFCCGLSVAYITYEYIMQSMIIYMTLRRVHTTITHITPSQQAQCVAFF